VTVAAPARSLADAVVAALRTVRDPELDEDLVALGFVGGVEVDEDGGVDVRLRLPTYWCAPNFAFLMAADAHAAVSALPGVTAVRVRLQDHFASEEIDAGLAAGRGFDDAFGDDADGGGLAELRALFDRKAFLARQQRLCEALLADGRSPAELARLTLADVPPSEEARHYLARRADLGLDGSPCARFVVTPAGDPVDADRMVRQLRIGRSVRVSIDGNAGLCRGLLATRYGSENPWRRHGFTRTTSRSRSTTSTSRGRSVRWTSSCGSGRPACAAPTCTSRRASGRRSPA
jgi:metal-sulfur cluster biosynthetic enzyme